MCSVVSSKTFRKRKINYRITGHKYFGEYQYPGEIKYFDEWIKEKMKNNKDIEIYDHYFIIKSLEMLKYCFEHVRLFKYNNLCEKVYINKKEYFNRVDIKIYLLDDFEDYYKMILKN